MKELFVSVTGFRYYYGIRPFRIGAKLRCKKEPGNPYDSEAIRVSLRKVGTIGYIANSVHTRANGTKSASGIYERVPKKFRIEVLFTTQTKAICRVHPEKKKKTKKTKASTE